MSRNTITAELYDINGKIQTKVSIDRLSPGYHVLSFQTKPQNQSGIYFLKIDYLERGEGISQIQKIVLTR